MAGEPAPRVVLRPMGNPLPLGFLALAIGTTALAALQLGWVPPEEGRAVALTVLLLTAPLQLLTSILGFAARDPVAGTGMGVLAGTWACIGATMLTSPPGATSPGLGVALLAAGAALLVPASAATGKLVAAAVLATAGLRFALSGVQQVTGSAGWAAVAGVTGLVLAALAAYAALAFELEDVRGRTVLPLARRGQGRGAVREGLAAQEVGLEHEAGVRRQL
jgi:uncharacterized protein